MSVSIFCLNYYQIISLRGIKAKNMTKIFRKMIVTLKNWKI